MRLIHASDLSLHNAFACERQYSLPCYPLTNTATQRFKTRVGVPHGALIILAQDNFRLERSHLAFYSLLETRSLTTPARLEEDIQGIMAETSPETAHSTCVTKAIKELSDWLAESAKEPLNSPICGHGPSLIATFQSDLLDRQTRDEYLLLSGANDCYNPKLEGAWSSPTMRQGETEMALHIWGTGTNSVTNRDTTLNGVTIVLTALWTGRGYIKSGKTPSVYVPFAWSATT
jgi:hypothetical protein